MTDYSQLIDAETWAFIRRTNAFYPPDAVEQSIAEQRRTYDRMARAFHADPPPRVSSRDDFIDMPDHRISVRIYTRTHENDAARVLFFHGGGFMLGGLESHDDVCAELCAGTGYEVISVDYRLMPEHPHPAAFADCLAAFRHVAAGDARRIILCGDSAGGNLAAAVAGAARDDPRPPAGQVLIYPGLGGATDRGSYVAHANAPLLSTRDVAYYDRMRADGRDMAGDASFAPLAAGDHARLPPTLIIAGACDPLADDGPLYAERIRAAGGRALARVEPGLVHGYLRARHHVARARASFARIVDAVRMLGAGTMPREL